jgi:hypothetical protein
MRSMKLNWIAILVAAIASFLFEALWFTLFMNPWLTGVGRSREWLMTASIISPALQYGTALLCSLIAATILTIAIQATGEQNARRGILCAALIWLGFVATSWAKEYVFELRTLQIFAINAGYFLFDLMIMGAIVGAWKKKPRTTLP